MRSGVGSGRAARRRIIILACGGRADSSWHVSARKPFSLLPRRSGVVHPTGSRNVGSGTREGRGATTLGIGIASQRMAVASRPGAPAGSERPELVRVDLAASSIGEAVGARQPRQVAAMNDAWDPHHRPPHVPGTVRGSYLSGGDRGSGVWLDGLMKVSSADRSREVAGRAMRLHYEMAGLVSRYGELPADLRSTVTQLFVDGASVFTIGARPGSPSSRCRRRPTWPARSATCRPQRPSSAPG